MNKISVISLDKKFKKCELKIQGFASKILKILNKDSVEAEIYLINSQKMKSLNKKFRGKDKTTTVLSFEEPRNFVSPPSKYRKIGEIYLNVSDVRRQKSEVRSQLLIHGLLHLLGYNHKKKNDRIRMMRIEQYVYNRS